MKNEKVCISKSVGLIAVIVAILLGVVLLANYTGSQKNAVKSRADEKELRCAKITDKKIIKEKTGKDYDYIIDGNDCNKCGMISYKGVTVRWDSDSSNGFGCTEWCIQHPGDAPAMCPVNWVDPNDPVKRKTDCKPQQKGNESFVVLAAGALTFNGYQVPDPSKSICTDLFGCPVNQGCTLGNCDQKSYQYVVKCDDKLQPLPDGTTVQTSTSVETPPPPEKPKEELWVCGYKNVGTTDQPIWKSDGPNCNKCGLGGVTNNKWYKGEFKDAITSGNYKGQGPGCEAFCLENPGNAPAMCSGQSFSTLKRNGLMAEDATCEIQRTYDYMEYTQTDSDKAFSEMILNNPALHQTNKYQDTAVCDRLGCTRDCVYRVCSERNLIEKIKCL